MNNLFMDKYERRRLRVQELIKMGFDNKQARFAEAISRDANYVSRMLYPAEKPGRKRIAEDMQAHIERSCSLTPGWLDMELGTPLIPDGAVVTQGAEVPWRPWPFVSITPDQWESLTPTQRKVIEDVALALLASTAAKATHEDLAPAPQPA